MSMTMGQLASKLAAAADKTSPEAQKNLRALAQVGTGLVKRSIQEYHAVDTGTMLNSTVAEAAGPNAYLVGPTVQYAAFVALGTSRAAARPFHIAAAAKLSDQASDFDLNLGV